MNKCAFSLPDSYSVQRVKDMAHGRWQEIHRRLGIPEAFLNPRKHSPCPSCGGRDRYRYTDYQGEGGYICNQCGAGNGFDLLMLVYGYDFKSALHDVAGVLGLSQETINRPSKPSLPLPAIPQGQDQLPRLKALWQAAIPMGHDISCPICNYLTGRSLGAMSAMVSLRYAPELPYWHGGEIVQHSPAMLARIDDHKGQMQGLHITYLQSHYPRAHGEDGLHCPQFSKLKLIHEGETLAAKKMRVRLTGAIKGAGVYLQPLCRYVRRSRGHRKRFSRA